MKPKSPFTKNGNVYVGFFVNELKNVPFEFLIKNDTKVHIVTQELKDKYPAVGVQFGNTIALRHEIPTKEFTEFILKDYEPPIGPFGPKTDDNIDYMTIRDFFCIIHKIPKSEKEWLNNLIKQNE